MDKIKLDLSRDKLLSEQATQLLIDYYMIKGESSPQEAFARAALAYCDGDYKFAQRIYDYASKQWFMFASPVLSNAPVPNGKWKSLPISCFLTYVGDTLKDLISHNAEVAWLSVKGGGVGGHWSDVRAVGDKSPGPIPFLKVVDSQMTAYKQGKTRKGSYAAYMDISHPEIEEFINMRKTTGGDLNRKCLNLHNGVSINDKFLSAVRNDDDWRLVDPKSNLATRIVSARDLWFQLIHTRAETGEPYIVNLDRCNEEMPQQQKDMGLKICQSNLCSEITLPTDEERTAVCCLSSVNLEYFDEWRNDYSFIPDLVTMLDNILQHFIDNAVEQEPETAALTLQEFMRHVKQDKTGFAKAAYSVYRERAIGLGAMGFHAYLQRQDIAFESMWASSANHKMFSHIKAEATRATKQLAQERGECPDGKGHGVRNAHLLAVAPNASSSIICGNTSPSIEPYRANAFTQKTKSGSSLLKNEYLEHLLQEIGMDTDEVWKSIMTNGGSVQHLEFLDDHAKEVFRTGVEIDQRWVIQHAADRQQYICQSQSLNVFFPANVSKQELHAIHMMSWKKKVKTLYYLRSEAMKRAENVSDEALRKYITDSIDENACLACEG